MSQADLARQALRWYMDNYERLQDDKRETVLAQTLDKMTNRICGMLARVDTKIGTLYELKWQEVPQEAFLAAVSKTKDNLRKTLVKDEQALAAKYKKVMTVGNEGLSEASGEKVPQKSDDHE
jgi:hypothetical protein